MYIDLVKLENFVYITNQNFINIIPAFLLLYLIFFEKIIEV